MQKTIYTANFNKYDTLKEPTIITPGWKYVYFTDQKNLTSKNWEIRVVSPTDAKGARKLKILNPFHDHDISIWIDASMTINCDLNEFVDKYMKTDLNLMNHPDRSCIYQEAKACIKRHKDDPFVINQQIESYLSIGYPPDHGMVATGVIIRKRNSQFDLFYQKWWREVELGSKRDQLSFNFVHWLHDIKYSLFPFEILKTDMILNKHL